MYMYAQYYFKICAQLSPEAPSLSRSTAEDTRLAETAVNRITQNGTHRIVEAEPRHREKRATNASLRLCQSPRKTIDKTTRYCVN